MAEVKDMLVKIVVTSSGQVVAIPGLIGPEYVPFEVNISTMLAAYKEGHKLYVETYNGDLLLVDDDLCLKIMEMTSLTDDELKKLIEDAKIRNAYYQSLTSLQDVVSLLIKLIGMPVDGLDNIEKLSKAIKAILANKEYASFTEVYDDIVIKTKALKDAQEAGDTALEEYIDAYIELNDKALKDLSDSINDKIEELKTSNDEEHQLIRDDMDEIYQEFTDKFTAILNSESLKSFKDVEDAIEALHEQNTDTILDKGGEFEIAAQTIVEHIDATEKTLAEHDISIQDLDDTKVDKEAGKGLYPDTDKTKVEKLIITGDGDKVLYDDGIYKTLRGPYVQEVRFGSPPYKKDDFFVFEKLMCRVIVDEITFDSRESVITAISVEDVMVLQAESEIKEYIVDETYSEDILIKYNGNLYITRAKFKATDFDDDLTADNIAIVGAASRAKIKEYQVGYDYQLDEMLTINKILYRANKTFTATDIETDITAENIVVVSDGLTHVLLKDWVLGLELKKDELCISDGILYRALIDHIAVNLTNDRVADKIELVSDGITRVVLNPWKTGTEYMKNEIFESGAILYRAKVTHTSSILDADIIADNIEIISDGLLRAKVEDWATDVLYTKDDIILHNKVMYRCLLTHTSGVFDTDNKNLRWQTVSSDAKRCTIEDWLTNTAYDVNNIVLYSKELYRVKSAHTSGVFASDLASGLLELFSEGLKQAAIGPWISGAKFGKYDVFTMNNFIYRATSAHTSGTFDTDLTNGLVELLGIKTTTLNTYAPSTKYAVNEIFVYSSIIYRVKVAHTSSTDTTPDTDFNLNRTEKIGFNTKFFIPAWTTNTSYGINEVFGIGKLIYRAKVAHTSAATYDLDLNSGKIEVLGSARDPWIRQWVAGTKYAVDDLVYSSAKIYRAKTEHTASASIDTDVASGKMEMLSYEGLSMLTWVASTAYKKYNILLDNADITNRYEVVADYTSDAVSIDNDVTNGKLIKYQIHEKNKDIYLNYGGVNQVSAYEIKVMIDTVKFLTVGNVTLLIDDNNVGITKTYSSAKIEELIDNCAKYSDVYTKEYMNTVFALKEDLDFDTTIIDDLSTDDKDNLYYKDVLIKNDLRQRIVEYTFSEVYIEYGKCIDLPNILLNFGLINPVKITATFYNKDTKAITFGVKKADSLTFLQEVDIAKDKCETYELPSYTDLEIYAEGTFRVDVAITGYNLADFVDLTVYNNHERNMDDGIGYGTPYAISARWIYEAMEFLKGVDQASLHNKDLDEWLAKNKAYAISAQTLYNHIANHPPSKTPPSQAKVTITSTPQIIPISGVNTAGKVLVQPYEYNTDGKLNIQTVVETFDNLTGISGDLSYIKSTNGVLQPVNSETVVSNTTVFGSGKLAIFDKAGLSADVNILGQSIISNKTISKPQSTLIYPTTGTLRYDTSSLLLFSKSEDVVSIGDTNAYSDTLVYIPTLSSYLKGNFTGDIFKLIVKRHTGGAAKIIKIDGIEYSFNDYYSSDVYMSCVFVVTGLSPFIEHTFEIYGDNTYVDAIDISIGCELKTYAENSTNRYGGILLYKDAKFYTYNDTTKTATELVGVTTPTESDFNASDYKLTDFTSNEYMVYVYTSSYNIASFTISRSFIKPVISLYKTITVDKTITESLASLAINASATNNSKIKVGFIDTFSRVVSVIGGTTVNVLDVTSKADILAHACDLANISTMFNSTRLSEIYTTGSITIVLFIIQDSVSDVITLTEIDLYINKYGTQKLLKESYYDVDITVGTGAMEVTIYNKVGKVITINYY